MTAEIVSAVVGKIVEMVVNPMMNTVGRQFSYIFCYKRNLQTLRQQLAGLDATKDGVQLSIDAAGRNLEIVDPTINEWLKEVDIIKSKVDAVHEGTSIVEQGCLNGWCPNVKHRYLLSRKATKLTQDIGKLKVEVDKDVKFSHSAPPVGIISSEGPSVSPDDNGFKGFETRISTMNGVMDALKDDKINLIGISGMGGVGKTTLVKQVLEKVKAERLFNEVAMSVVSQRPDLVTIQGEIGEKLGLKFDVGSSDARAVRLCERLKKGGRVLVVLDDIWERVDLGEVGIPVGSGCKVVFTTRMEDVCIEMEVQKHFTVQMLSQPEAWELFRKEAGDCVEDEDLQDIAKEVAKECGGLPIAIVTLGKALSERKKHEWEDTRLKLKQSSGMVGKVKSSIMLSYDFLGSRRPEAQQLLLLCTLFQEDENIQIEWLVKYMMGLDQLSKEVATLEQTRNRVCTLVDNLKFCNLLLQGDGKYADLCVRLHDVVRDVCMSIASNPPHAYLVSHAREMKQWPIHNGNKADHTAIALMSGEMKEIPGGLDYPNLRLLKLQLESENINIAGEFFQGMSGLKVFDWKGREYGSSVHLPRTLGELTNLQALSLEYCKLRGDLSSIGCLKGLKILSFFRSELDELPREIGELKNLKLLDLRCNEVGWPDLRRRFQDHGLKIETCVLSGLDQLEVLYMGTYRVSKSIKELNSLCYLTTLQINIANSLILLELEQPLFEKLKRFDIYIGCWGEFSCGEYGILKNNITQREDDLSWVSHTKLRSLVRRIQHFELITLDEERFMLDERESGFSALPNLESLEISCMYNLREISPDSKIPQGSFHRLQKLCLSYLPKLEQLWRGSAQQPSLSNLRLLDIKSCHSIESLFSPDVANCMLQLEDLWIRDCEGLKGVVVSNQGKNIQFPKLKSIFLEGLTNFKSFFYPDWGSEDLDGKRGTIHTLFNQWVNFPSLEKIYLETAHSVEQIVGYQMQDGLANKLQSITVFSCKELRNFVNLGMFENLEEVAIWDCNSIEVVWKMVPDGIKGFRNLTTLKVVWCEELRYLMSHSVAKMLVNLKSLELKKCPKIVGVIEGEDEEESSSEAKSKECIVFPQLQKLTLEDLKRLISFSSSKCSLEFPLLVEVEIRGCPDMKRFCGGEVKAPVLKQPVEVPYGGKWMWVGNLNNGIYR